MPAFRQPPMNINKQPGQGGDDKSTDSQMEIRLLLLDAATDEAEMRVKVREQITAGVEIDAFSGVTRRRVRVHRIEVDPSAKPHILVIGQTADLRESFPILSTVRRCFSFLRLLSVGHWLREWGMKLGRRVAVRCVDYYIIGWFLFEVLALSLLNVFTSNHILSLLFAVAAGYRIIELVQVYFNILLFDPLQHFEAGEAYFLYSSARSVLISIVSYAELICCYAIFYDFAIPWGFSKGAPIADALGALYFSTITATTVGYGDITPVGNIRIVAMSEVLFSVLFTVTIVARFLNFLPSPKGAFWNR